VATPSEKLAESLEALHELQERGVVAVKSSNLSETHRERLVQNGFLKKVMKGWYIPSGPDEKAGDSTAWYASFWGFCAAYLEKRFGSEWCLSPEQSLSLHAGNRTIPRQLLARTPKGGNKPTNLPHDTSLLEVRAALPEAGHETQNDGLRVFSLPASLIFCAPGFFLQNPTDTRVALSMIRDGSEVLGLLLDGGRSKVAGRLAGAFRNIGRDKIADQILSAMRAAMYKVEEVDPFEEKPTFAIPIREPSPYVSRIRLMWQTMRESVIENFPNAPGISKDVAKYLKAVEDVYVQDAYHSLSIENYRVSRALIERVRSSSWNPDTEEKDREDRNALAARGYWQAFQVVKESVEKVLANQNAGTVGDDNHRGWYQELFGPSVVAGILEPADLAGYRRDQVYIRRSMHTPPKHEAVIDCMETLFEQLKEEEEVSVRVVLGHFVFVYIHPHMDGNGRMGRFLMNLMLASGGYPWTVIPVEERDAYMSALESASVSQDIEPFAKFLARLVKDSLEGKPTPQVPEEKSR
jgi:hypothetical protein